MLSKLLERWQRSKLLATIVKFVDEQPTPKSNTRALRHTLLLLFACLVVIAIASVILMQADVAILDPKGTIGNHQRNLLLFAGFLSLLVVIPVFVLTFVVAWKYREENKKAEYAPGWDNSVTVEAVWWGVPIFLIIILSIVTWKSSHDLDPFKALASEAKPVTVQVVALQWKWLFIYPEEGIASVNHLQIPVDRPINFTITSDAPMNSFWIPRLGGQVYAMSGMTTQLHLMATKPGSYPGSSANISGEGYSNMNFTAEASSQEKFDEWVKSAQSSTRQLTKDTYVNLAKPSVDESTLVYSKVDADLYDTIVMQYMSPDYQLPKAAPQPLDAHRHPIHYKKETSL